MAEKGESEIQVSHSYLFVRLPITSPSSDGGRMGGAVGPWLSWRPLNCLSQARGEVANLCQSSAAFLFPFTS